VRVSDFANIITAQGWLYSYPTP